METTPEKTAGLIQRHGDAALLVLTYSFLTAVLAGLSARLDAAKKEQHPDLKEVLLALHDENGTVAYAAGDDVDGLASGFLALASSVAIPFVKHCDKDHAAKVNENPKDPANKTIYLFLVYLTALVAKNAGIDWNTHVRIAMDADEMGLK